MTRILFKTAWVELKLFARDPLTVVFTLALPVVLLFVLGGVFGNEASEGVYRGFGAMNYYVPAYVGLVIASMGLIGLPVHVAAYRELGVLRRFRASSVPVGSVLGAHVIVTLLLAAIGGVLLFAVARPVYDVAAPEWAAGVAGAFALSGVAFALIGLLLGGLLPTARAAQGAGVLLWFVMLILAGAGPPTEVLTDGMRAVGTATPLRHVILLLQDPWLGLGWNTGAMAAVLGFGFAAGLLVAWRFRAAAAP